jgi:hypothetical protein
MAHAAGLELEMATGASVAGRLMVGGSIIFSNFS